MTTFVDTSYMLALMLTDDAHHASAVSLQTVITGPLLTSEYVLIELLDALTRGPLREMGLKAIDLLRRGPLVEIVPAATALMNEGMALFEARRDKEWGLTDCISFVLMHRAGISQALTSDRHFEQAGFVALLNLDPV